jgi:uncharacterized protein (TIGR03086 family)
MTAAARHLDVCARFATVVAAADAAGAWARPTPCTEWDARALLEHVIGFHDVLILRPLDAKPSRTKHHPIQRWAVTVEALRDVLDRPEVDQQLVAVLTQDVLVHTWDLARAIGADDGLDPELCASFVARLPDAETLEKSGMFGAPVALPEGADPQALLLARLGRDPNWTPPLPSSS